MPTNPYFAQFDPQSEQQLLHDLTQEVVRIHGIDCTYIVRSVVDKDSVFEEDITGKFEAAYEIEMYVESTQGFEGEGDFLGKFGVEIRDRVNFALARRSFEQEVTRYEPSITRPREGDLIYFPLNKKVFQIHFVEHEAMFYPLGDLYMYQCQCELFEYGNEMFNTGNPDIDRIQQIFTTNDYDWGLKTEDGKYLTTESGKLILLDEFVLTTQDPAADNDDIQVEADKITDFDELDPFSYDGRY